jgi:cysteine desulfurase/selenocysteine lyase
MINTELETLTQTETITREFPILNQKINGHPLVYLDNAATTQKPLSVIRALSDYYMNFNANIHRGIHALAEKATAEFELTRTVIRDFINAHSVEESIFVRGVTEAINLVASSYGRSFIEEGDEIIVSELEHHSNIVPWQILCEEKKAVLKVIPINDEGGLLLDEFVPLLSVRTKLVAVSHVSNSLGTINPIKEIVRLAHQQGAMVLIDGAQAELIKRLMFRIWTVIFIVCRLIKCMALPAWEYCTVKGIFLKLCHPIMVEEK